MLTNFKGYHIRPADNNDVDAIKQIVFSCLHEFGLKEDEAGKDNDLLDIEKNYFADNGYFGMVELTEPKTPVGTFGIHRIDDYTCELRKMYLIKEHRGKGLGEFMLRIAIDIAKELGFKRIALETISPLTAAIALYKKYGFTEIKPKEINSRVDQAFVLTIG